MIEHAPGGGALISGALLGAWTLGWSGAVSLVMLRLAGRKLREPAARSSLSPTASTSGPSAERPLVHLIRPCAGAELGLESRLLSVLKSRGLEDVELIVTLTTGRPDDPASGVCESAAATLRRAGVSARACAYDLESGPDAPTNQKVGQIALAIRQHRAELIVNVDSDVELDGFDFGELLRPLLADEGSVASKAVPRVGATWAVPVEEGGYTCADRDSAAVLDTSLHAFGLLGELDPKTLVGKVFALRQEALEQAGGLQALTEWLGEDMELARRLRNAGWGVVRVNELARARVSGRDHTQVRDRYARWMAVIRWQRPHLLASYPILFFPAGALFVGWLTFALAVPDLFWFGVTAALWSMALRWLLALAARRASGRSLQGALRAGLRADRLLARSWVECLRSPKVVWRGRTFVKGADGRMQLG